MGEAYSPPTKKKLAMVTGLSFGSPKELSDAIHKQVEKPVIEEPEPI